MECLRAKKLLSEYLDGMLDTPTAAHLEAHLSECAPCRRQLADLKKMVNALNRLDPVNPPHNFLAQIHERLQPASWLDRTLKKLFFPLKVKLPLELAAAALMAVVVFGVIAVQDRRLATAPSERISAARTAVKKMEDADRVSPRSRKADATSVSEQLAVDDKEYDIQPVILSLVVTATGFVDSAALSERPAAPAASSAGEVAGGADEDKGTESYFKTPRRIAEPSAQKAVTSDAPAEPPARDHDQLTEKRRSHLSEIRHQVITLVRSLEGDVPSGTADQAPSEQRFLTVTVPAVRFNEFIARLKQIAPFEDPPPAPPPDQRLIPVRIQFRSPDM